MAKRRSFFERVSQRVRRDFGKGWTKETVDSYARSSLRRSQRRGTPTSDLVGPSLIQTLQHEADLRSIEEEYFFNRDMEPPEPPLYPGLIVAWERMPTTVEIADALVRLEETDNEFAEDILSVPLSAIRSLFPACLLIDVRNRKIDLYGIALEALFVYPSHDEERGYDLLLICGVGLKRGMTEPLLAKLVLTGETLEDALEDTEDEVERLMARVLSDVDAGHHDEIFSPLEDESWVRDVCASSLALMFCQHAATERHVRRLTTHLSIVPRERADASKTIDLATTSGVHVTRPAPAPPVRTAKARPARKAHAPEVAEVPVEQPDEHEAPESVATETPEVTAAGVQAPVPEGAAPVTASVAHQVSEGASGLEEELLEEVGRLEAELAAERAKTSSLRYHLRQARESIDEMRAAAGGEALRAEVLSTMEVPTTPEQALLLAERVFPDRIRVLDEAKRSAREFTRGSCQEVWAVLRSIAVTLHPMIFGPGHTNVVYAFQNECGFELALREMKLAKVNREFQKLRCVTYKGQEHYASSHVKGRGRADGETLRVHFFADYEDQLLIISHCGEHLATYDTASR